MRYIYINLKCTNFNYATFKNSHSFLYSCIQCAQVTFWKVEYFLARESYDPTDNQLLQKSKQLFKFLLHSPHFCIKRDAEANEMCG